MSKILVSLMTIALVGVLVGGGIYAAFSDSEMTADNTLTAGTLDIKVGTDDPTTESIAVSNVKPTDSGNAATWPVNNIGSITGNLTIALGAITNFETTLTEPESSAGDATSGATQGELGTYLQVAVWLDVDESGTWNTGDIALNSDASTTTSTGVEPLPYDALDDYDSDSYADVIVMTADDSGAGGTDEFQFMVDYEFPNDANDDRAQNDSVSFNVTFTLDQA